MKQDCEICNWIVELQTKDSPFLIREFETGYAVISKYQYEYYKGYTLFLCKQHVRELHELDEEFKLLFLKEISAIKKTLYFTIKPHKLNYEMLENGVSHAHAH